MHFWETFESTVFHYIWEFVLTFDNFLVKFGFVRCFERLVTEKNCKEQNSRGPNVSSWTIVFNLGTNFRWHVSWSSAEDLHFVFRLCSESKIDHLCHIIGRTHVHQNVFWFDISVCNTFLVIKIHGWYNLFKDFCAYAFWKKFFWGFF